MILAILPRGEAIRNFVWSGALDNVAKRTELAVLSVIPDAAIGAHLRERFGAVYELPDVSEPRAVSVAHEILDIAHGRHLWSEAAKVRWELRDAEAATFLARAKRFAKKGLATPFANPRGIATVSRVLERSASRGADVARATRMLRRLKPSLVFNGSHVHASNALPFVRAARALGIPTVAFIFSWDNLTSQGRIIPGYDHYLVWNESIREQLLTIYPDVRNDQVTVTGTPQFDFHMKRNAEWSRDELCSKIGADPGRPYVLYATGMANHMPGEPRIVEGVGRIVREMGARLVVRVYPKDRSGRFEPLRGSNPDILFPRIPWAPAWLTPLEEDSLLLPNMLRHATACVNVASTVSLESCMFDVPVVNVGYPPPGMDVSPIDYGRYYSYDHYRPIVESGAVEVAWSEGSMAQILPETVRAPGRRSAERAMLLKRFFGELLDGHSADRVADTLVRLEADRDVA